MKNLLVITLIFSCLTVFGQEFKTEIGSVSKKKVFVYLDKSDLQIKATNSTELVIKTDDDFTTAIPERAKGLKPLYNSAEDNTGIGLEVQKTESGIYVKRASGKSIDYNFEIPAGFDIYFELGFQSGDIKLDGFAGEVEIDSKISDVEMKNISGPVTINTISGNIEVVYNSEKIIGPSTLNTVSGDIDVTLPKTSKLDIEMNTLTGEVFVSDPSKFKKEDKENKSLYHIGGHMMKTEYNGGGEDLNLITVSGNIYFREN